MSTDAKSSNGSLLNREDLLLQDFRTTQLILQAITNANYQAIQTETEVLRKLATYKGNSDIYINPQNISPNDETNLSSSSLNSQIQKVQADQIKQYGLQMIGQLEKSVNSMYRDKKIKITVITNQIHPIQNQWLDSRSGKIYYGINKGKSVNGKVININLTENYIVVKPSVSRQLISKALINYIIEVIIPGTNEPLVKISIR